MKMTMNSTVSDCFNVCRYEVSQIKVDENDEEEPDLEIRPREEAEGDDWFMAARRAYQEPIEPHDLGSMNVPCQHCGALHWMAEKLKGSSESNPKLGTCCNHGKIDIPLLESPPEALRQLFTGQDSDAKEFRKNITRYNAAFAFTSLGAKMDRAINHSGRSGWVFRICGNLYHSTRALEPPAGQAPSYAQLYIYDPEVALQQRMRRNDNLRQNTMRLLQNVMLEHNAYASVYKHAHEILSEEHNVRTVNIRLRVMPGNDRRRYNLPTADEVAVILPGDGVAQDKRDVILRFRDPERGSPFLRIHDGHVAYAPLHYVLFFPSGQAGWHRDLRVHDLDKERPSRLTQTRYYAFRLHWRPEELEFSTILRGQRLLQHYCVDMWASAEQNRLSFLYNNQSRLRASLYSGLQDAADSRDDNVNLNDLGQRCADALHPTHGS
jgi:hypothetical protein